MAVLLLAKVRERGLGLQPRLYVGSVCVAQLCCSCSMRLVALYECHGFPFDFVGCVVTVLSYLLISMSFVSNVSRRNGLLMGMPRLTRSFHHILYTIS